MSPRPLRDSKIAEILNIFEDSDDDLEDDDDSIADPDYQAENEMEQEQFSNDENEDDSELDPSPSTSAVLTGSQPTQLEGHPRKPKTQPAIEKEKPAFE
ncbi:hypothetical protein HHI36_015458 [Cryptolaemus montrouzieri]|uniref:Uncharacterized protein n=1 Tax=Cryptolaemus montrouzieri TaxID=559131 RepID=A0ABD2N6Z6_9CUCU